MAHCEPRRRNEPQGRGLNMRCEQVRQLFDAYLDGDLSPSQATEVGAHRLHCAECRRTLALMEVSGHILASDRDQVSLPGDFTDRLLACVKTPRSRWRQALRRTVYIGGPMAAAAMIGLAFLGAFNRPGPSETRVLGEKEVNHRAVSAVTLADPAASSKVPTVDSAAAAQQGMERWLKGMSTNVRTVQQLDLTVLQWIEYLKEVQSTRESNFADDEMLGPLDDSETDESTEDPPAAGEEIEDL